MSYPHLDSFWTLQKGVVNSSTHNRLLWKSKPVKKPKYFIPIVSSMLSMFRRTLSLVSKILHHRTNSKTKHYGKWQAMYILEKHVKIKARLPYPYVCRKIIQYFKEMIALRQSWLGKYYMPRCESAFLPLIPTWHVWHLLFLPFWFPWLLNLFSKTCVYFSWTL